MASIKLYLFKLFITAVAFSITAILLYPVIYIFLTAFSSLPTLTLEASYFTLNNFVSVINDVDFRNSLILSSLVSGATIFLALLFITPAAYAFSRFRFRGKSTALYSYLIFSQVSGGFGVASLVALFVFLGKLNLVNIYVLPFLYVSGMVPFNTWLLKNYFDSIPRELDEAAFVDGSGWWTLMFRVILPSSKAPILVLAIFAFMGAWSEFILANLFGFRTLPVLMYKYVGAYTTYWNMFAATAILYAIPIIVMYMVAQRFIGEAVRMGIKG